MLVELEEGRDESESESSIVSGAGGYNGTGDAYPYPWPGVYSSTFPLEWTGDVALDAVYEGEGEGKGGDRHTPFFRMAE